MEKEVALSPNAFCRYSEEGDPVLLPGEHTLHIGFTQPDDRSCRLYGQKPNQVTVRI